MGRASISRWFCVVATILVVAVPAPHGRSVAKAGFFDFIGDVISAPFKLAGKAVGSFFGSGIDAATAPTIQNLEQTGHRLIGDLDNSMKARLDQLQGIVDNSLVKMDSIMASRITQIDAALAERIKQLDDSLGQNIGRFGEVVAAGVAQLDGVIEKRLNEFDQITERRVGNLDTVATKASLSFEEALTRLVGVGCLLALAAAIAWRLYVESLKALSAAQAKDPHAGLGGILPRVLGRVAAQGALGAMALGLVLVAVRLAPGSARGEAEKLRDVHVKSARSSLAAGDFARAEFHMSQLQLLDPADTSVRLMSVKIGLLRDVFVRPTVLMHPGPVRQIAARIERADQIGGLDDPDMVALKAYVTWRVAPSRAFEYASACFAAAAIDLARRRPGEHFLLRGLAVGCLENYLSAPIDDKAVKVPDLGFQRLTLEQLTTVLQRETNVIATGDEFASIRYVSVYNRNVRELLKTTYPAYKQLLDAHWRAMLKPPSERAELLAQRKRLAGKILSSWNSFYDGLKTESIFAGTGVQLAVCRLADAVQARAGVFASDLATDAAEFVIDQPIAPTYKEWSAGKSLEDPVIVNSLPLRARVERDFMTPLFNPLVRNLLVRDEYSVFLGDEVLLRSLEDGYVRYQVFKARNDIQNKFVQWESAVRSVAALGIYIDQASWADLLLDEVDTFDGNLKDQKRAEIESLTNAVPDLINGRRLPVL